ncbi:DNA-directed RNA polymerase III subunit RPC4-like [Ylistrum balloti]|uniref:DNA-directed RNA polymerase III subunit RPC4-like n=1 Tax=Ylistrum balloti TaxID=509963 RepID=UPI0029058CF1|nr:DNA-directed RNA polymerase III subunit RPC4-like [Ylistrum balloti]
MASKKQPDLPRGLIGRTGVPTGRGSRLPSLKGPRDLTLGGVPKKVFIPTIPAARRDKTKDSHIQDEGTKKEGKRGHGTDKKFKGPGSERGRGGGQGRGRGKPLDVIQSHSIFEQGPTEKLNKGAGFSGEYLGSRGGGGGGGGSISTSDSGVIKSRIKMEKGVDGSKQVLDYLLRDDFIDTPYQIEDPTTQPVILPLCAMVDSKPDLHKISNIKIKTEPGLAVEKDIKPPKVSGLRQSPIVSDENCDQLFTNLGKTENSDLLFFQFPDTMPGVPSNSRDEEGDGRQKSGNKDGDDLVKQIGSCSLSEFSEGYMGKLVVRKSGRTQLVLGNITLDVSMGTKCGFLQDLVSIETRPGGRDGGHMAVLGHVNKRLVCTPDFDSLLTL